MKKGRVARDKWAWQDYEGECTTWVQVVALLTQLAGLHCDSKPLVAQGDFVNAHTMGYRYHCAFCRTHACKWLCRVLIPRSVGVPVSKDQRHVVHATVAAGMRVQVVVDVSHSNHRDATPRGAHPVYTSAARQHRAMLDFSRQQVQTWLQEHQLPAAPADVQKCVRHNWHHRQSLLKQSVCACVGADMELSLRGSVFALAKSLDFCTLINELTPGALYFLCIVFSFSVSCITCCVLNVPS